MLKNGTCYQDLGPDHFDRRAKTTKTKRQAALDPHAQGGSLAQDHLDPMQLGSSPGTDAVELGLDIAALLAGWRATATRFQQFGEGLYLALNAVMPPGA